MKHLLIILSLLFSITAFGQSSKSIKRYREAQSEMTNGNSDKALVLLNKAIDKDPDFVDALVLKGDILKLEGQLEASIESYETALKYSNKPYIMLFYARVLFENKNYDKASLVLNKYLEKPNVSEKYLSQANLLLRSCAFAKKATKEPKDFEPENLGPNVNSEAMEYFPSISVDGKQLVFTKRDPNAAKSDEDFWISNWRDEDGEWGQSKPIEGRLNSALNEGAQSLSADGKILFFTGCQRPDGYGSCDIYASFYLPNETWSPVMNLGTSINTGLWESQPSISSDGRTLYFTRGKSSSDPNIDVYYSTLSNDGYWSKAQPIKGKVNTSGQDVSPYIHFDNQTLYFASNGHPGMGDLDFFVSRIQEDGSWGEPENLGYPINTSEQEFSMVVSPDGAKGYFASKVEGGFGKLDLYSFELPDESRAIEIAYVKGIVQDSITGEKLSLELEYLNLSTNTLAKSTTSDKNGAFFSVLPKNADYALIIKEPGYLFYSKNFNLESSHIDYPTELNVYLLPIMKGAKVILDNIFFETDSDILSKESRVELLVLADFMKENNEVRIAIEGHTDDIGDDAYNLKLSKARAQSVVNYLIKSGVDSKRLEAKGYGETKPIIPNDSDESRAMNRRTEFRVL